MCLKYCQVLSQSQLVRYLCAVTQSLSCWLLDLFSVCSQPWRPACHRGVTVRGLSRNPQKRAFFWYSGGFHEPSRVSPAEGGGRRGLAHSQVWISHLFTQLCTLEKSKKPETSLITSFWWVVISLPEHQGVTSQHFCKCKINWNTHTWLQMLCSDALFGHVAASLGWVWGLRLSLSLECPQTLQSSPLSPTVGRAVNV